MLRLHPRVESTSEQAEDRLGGMARELQDVYDGRYLLVSSSRDQSILAINPATPLISSRAAFMISLKSQLHISLIDTLPSVFLLLIRIVSVVLNGLEVSCRSPGS